MAYTTIDDPSAYFTITLYTGDGNDNRAITNSANAGNFQPDWLWYKERSSTSSHRVFDSSRGASKRIEPDVTNAEDTDTSNQKSFDSNGFTVGTSGSTNADGDTYVAWQWKANGGTTSSNTDGSITSTVQANTTAGFSIVTYTGNGSDNSTIGHGLGKAPSMIILKGRSSVEDWMVYHKDLTAGSEIILNSTAAQADDTNNATWGDNHPSSVGSSTFAVGYAGDSNADGTTYVAYCFAEIKGYSKIGSYTGNGSTDGTFVYTGFKPAWVMYKNISSAADWLIYDTKRIHSGTQLDYLEPNTSDAEGFIAIDVLSNGFKLREASGDKFNTSGDKYIYMAFAEHPFVSSAGVPTTAR